MLPVVHICCYIHVVCTYILHDVTVDCWYFLSPYFSALRMRVEALRELVRETSVRTRTIDDNLALKSIKTRRAESHAAKADAQALATVEKQALEERTITARNVAAQVSDGRTSFLHTKLRCVLYELV